MSNYGREDFKNVRIKLQNNQASGVWHKFLNSFHVTIKPTTLSAQDGGVFRYRYSNNDESILIWCEHRPDQNTINTGHAGRMVLRVDSQSKASYRKVVTELQRISNIKSDKVAAKRVLRRKNDARPDTTVDHAVPNEGTTTKNEPAKITSLPKSRFKSFTELGDALMKHNSQNNTLHNIHALSSILDESGVEHVLVQCDEVTGAVFRYRSESERRAARKEAKKYRLRHKAELKRKAKKYRIKMKHKKPNPQRSRLMKKVHDRYNY